MFWTAVNKLKSPENAGMIVRSHVALGGAGIIVIGDQPWRFKKRAQAFSRRLEKLCQFTYVKDENDFFIWCKNNSVAPIAIDIASPPTLLASFAFPERAAIIVGNEGLGLSVEFCRRCAATVTIPQFGPVASLNAAVCASIVMYEIVRRKPVNRAIWQGKYSQDV